MHKQYNLINRNVPIIANKTQPKKDTPKVFDGKKDTPKVIEGKKDAPVVPPIKEAKKYIYVFNLENEISRIKISVPFGEILKVDKYRSKIVKILKSQSGAIDISFLLFLELVSQHLVSKLWILGFC